MRTFKAPAYHLPQTLSWTLGMFVVGTPGADPGLAGAGTRLFPVTSVICVEGRCLCVCYSGRRSLFNFFFKLAGLDESQLCGACVSQKS